MPVPGNIPVVQTPHTPPQGGPTTPNGIPTSRLSTIPEGSEENNTPGLQNSIPDLLERYREQFANVDEEQYKCRQVILVKKHLASLDVSDNKIDTNLQYGEIPEMILSKTTSDTLRKLFTPAIWFAYQKLVTKGRTNRANINTNANTKVPPWLIKRVNNANTNTNATTEMARFEYFLRAIVPKNERCVTDVMIDYCILEKFTSQGANANQP